MSLDQGCRACVVGVCGVIWAPHFHWGPPQPWLHCAMPSLLQEEVSGVPAPLPFPLPPPLGSLIVSAGGGEEGEREGEGRSGCEKARNTLR